ncbi:hypothetical protein FNF31_00513 [Cafeteria roenbergensis]|uniref:DUF2306 domain-containing protein n=1 Tax=Cafeteria roenbergensis TaxID=33653 RepID=A0A5A8DTK2_CAFRO|nr:hypothetical protein FNF31_00513 [Cafeteria roenbergensis]
MHSRWRDFAAKYLATTAHGCGDLLTSATEALDLTFAYAAGLTLFCCPRAAPRLRAMPSPSTAQAATADPSVATPRKAQPPLGISERAAWASLGVGALALSAGAIGTAVYFARNGARVQHFKDMLSSSAVPLYTHILGASLAPVLGVPQLSKAVRKASPLAHRVLGRVYVASVVVGGATGLYLAGSAFAGSAAKVSFGALAVVWLGTTAMGMRAAFQRNYRSHREWMTRSFALTMSALTLRLYFLTGVKMGFPFADVYDATTWMSWVVNLLAVEWIVLPSMRASSK